MTDLLVAPSAPTAPPDPATRPSARGPDARIGSLDIVRGLVMVLMALDHVRVYSGIPAGGPTAGVFLTRWVTHFCAPAFVFFAGTSAFFHGRKLADTGALARFLAIRGAWLVLLELTVLRLAWTFTLDFSHYMLAGVIWMLGWCMILMALLVRLPLAAIASVGIAVVAGHNLSAFASRDAIRQLAQGAAGPLLSVLYFGGGFPVGAGGGSQANFLVLYSIVPWIGVMAAGYAFGAVLAAPVARRRRACIGIGIGAIVAFVLLRTFNLYGDRPFVPNGRAPAWLLFLATTKYPASLQFLLMTLGPTIAVLPLLEDARGRLARWLTVFGRVPLFYYLLHIPFIHLVAVAVSLVRTPGDTGWLFAHHPMDPPPVPPGYTWSLALLYAVTVLVVVALYFPCRWFGRRKAERHGGWLSYL
jgi:uncharacterized membrane protein